MENLQCIIHYNIKNANYSKIKPISEINQEKIYAAKSIWKSKGGYHHHKEQCDAIPSEIDPTKHGIHLTPCYKKFAFIISQEKRKSLDDPGTSVRPKHLKVSEEHSTRNIYPKECNIYKRYRIERSGRHLLPTTISTQQAVNTIKEATEAKEDQSLYYEIKDLDLIAKEFKYHDVCCREFTTKEDVTHKKRKSPEDVRDTGNFEAVAKCIEEKIFNKNQTVSMTVLHELYGLHPEDARYRGTLKARIQTAYPEKLLFKFEAKYCRSQFPLPF